MHDGIKHKKTNNFNFMRRKVKKQSFNTSNYHFKNQPVEEGPGLLPCQHMISLYANPERIMNIERETNRLQRTYQEILIIYA